MYLFLNTKRVELHNYFDYNETYYTFYIINLDGFT